MNGWKAHTSVAVLTLVVLMAACNLEPVSHKVWNRSTQTIALYGVRERIGEFYIVQKLAPGTFYPITSFGDDCVDVILIARVSGTTTEIARRSGPFCPDDEWNVTDE